MMDPRWEVMVERLPLLQRCTPGPRCSWMAIDYSEVGEALSGMGEPCHLARVSRRVLSYKALAGRG
jgi:hypothetical protein